MIVINQKLPSYLIDIPLHNTFLNVATLQGLPVMLVYILLSFYCLMTLKRRWKSKYQIDSILPLEFFLFLSFFSYFAQSMVHNAGLPTGDLYGWILIGIIFRYNFINDFKSSIKVDRYVIG